MKGNYFSLCQLLGALRSLGLLIEGVHEPGEDARAPRSLLSRLSLGN